jgi:hypothetical protein
MALGSPWMYKTGFRTTDGLGVYTGVLLALTSWCLFLIARAALRDREAACERWMLALSAVGSFPALARPETTAAAATVLLGYVLFFRLRLVPGRLNHVLWHCSVFVGQLGFVVYTVP